MSTWQKSQSMVVIAKRKKKLDLHIKIAQMDS
jgi:hypothetical protein